MRKEDTAGQAAGHRNPKDHWKGGIGVEVIQRLAVLARSAVARIRGDERGFTTAELMANAALAILALVVIWAALQALGVDVVNWIRGQILK